MLKHLFLVAVLSASLIACTNDDPEPEVSKPETPEQPSEPSVPDEPSNVDPEPIMKEKEHHIAKISIDTKNGAPILSKEEYVKCTVTIDSDFDDWDFSASAGVRGRGNSTWLWYDKKPYRIKLDKKASLFGLGEGKSWVLLANFRDPTDLMNTFVFELGQLCEMPFTNHTRYVELTLNGKYNGLYQFTEQVQQGKGRVNVDEATGYLLSLDVDDGPAESPNAGDNFWSEVYRMPVCVKNPEDLSADALNAVKADFAVLESAIAAGDYERVKELMDMQSFMDFIMIQELVYNVELDAPRSMYIHKDKDKKWVMGPLWDFDGGYDFDWGNMYKGHGYFSDYRELVLGTDPAYHKGTNYKVPGFFSDLFKVKAFVTDYKMRWRQVSTYAPQAWAQTMLYFDEDVWKREADLWPIGKDPKKEISRMESWLNNRLVYLSNLISSW